MKQFLDSIKCNTPSWLQNYIPGQTVNMEEVLASRLVYYPGSGNDGQPIRTFNQAHSAHVFMYVDYGVSREELESVLSAPGIAGYSRLDRIELSVQDLIPNGWTPSIPVSKRADRFVRKDIQPFCFMDIYERQPEFDETHGSKRFAVIFLFADGIATYDAVFCANQRPAPFILVLQDHGFGGNWDRFGAGGVLEEIADKHGVYPDYMLVAKNSKVWAGYEQVPETSCVIGGMHSFERYLYAKQQ